MNPALEFSLSDFYVTRCRAYRYGNRCNDKIYKSESEFDSNSESDIVCNDESDTEEEEEEEEEDDKRKLALGKVHPWSTALKRNPLKCAWKLICFL